MNGSQRASFVERVTIVIGLVFITAAGSWAQENIKIKDKGEKGNKEKIAVSREEERILKAAEKAFLVETERDRWMKEMSKQFPGSTQGNARGEIDYSAWFDALSGGRDVWERTSIRIKPFNELFDRVAETVGTREVISKNQFLVYSQRSLAGEISPPWKPRNNENDKNLLEQADKAFNESDRNRNNMLELEEQSEALRSVSGQFDQNRDGLIDLNEYRGYFSVRLNFYRDNPSLLIEGSKKSLPPESSPAPQKSDEPPVKGNPTPTKEPVAPTFKAPEWFRFMDEDHDGQVGLYEWRLIGGRLSSEFVPLDANEDGLLTPSELHTFLDKHQGSPYAKNQLPPPVGGGQPWYRMPANDKSGKSGKNK